MSPETGSLLLLLLLCAGVTAVNLTTAGPTNDKEALGHLKIPEGVTPNFHSQYNWRELQKHQLLQEPSLPPCQRPRRSTPSTSTEGPIPRSTMPKKLKDDVGPSVLPQASGTPKCPQQNGANVGRRRTNTQEVI
ncbi:uncharacterized protein LOC120936000 isoform X2 [Rana temporaria]|uniref:uncharacterized protein LOC120936000 isoform X2 n=1 Tax=Rana temporaria TaxID=8407 RepID=UPI001AAD4E0F|nr:uncharacterized protein LOC120936000 isoform X2 [Rana temporaria]